MCIALIVFLSYYCSGEHFVKQNSMFLMYYTISYILK